MKLVTPVEMQEIDRRAQDEFRIPSLLLMESAGAGAWRELASLIGDERPALCAVAGQGNNGGDALVIARYAHLAGFPVRAVLARPRDELGDQCALHATILDRLGIPTLVWPDPDARRAVAECGLVIDGLAGTGIIGALRQPLVDICAAINDRAPSNRVAAVDTPSGIADGWHPGMPAVRADWTLTMGVPKTTLYEPAARPLCGEIRTIALSFPPALLASPSLPGRLLNPDELTSLLPPLADDAYKHRRGVVAVFAGAPGSSGAAVLCGETAQRCRAGLVTIFTDESIYSIVASSVRAVMVRPFTPDGELPQLRAILDRFDAVVAGPGWGVGAGRAEFLDRILGEAPRGVLDADALNLLAARDTLPRLGERWVVTPHPGELARLLGRSSAEVAASMRSAAAELAGRTGAVVVAKSSVSVVAHPDGRFAVVDGCNAAMGTGGTGDVLAGAIGGLLAGGMGSWEAACAATLAHQVAGSRLRRRAGIFLAEELAVELGAVADGR